MTKIATFIARQAPRYGRDEFESRGYENLLGQRALWSALAFMALAERRGGDPQAGLGVEIRLASGAGGTIELSLSLIDPRGKGVGDDIVRQIERLLPAEYAWRRGAPRYEDGVRDLDDQAWRVARVVRQTEYVDLPYHSLVLARGGNIESGLASLTGYSAQVDASDVSQEHSYPFDPAQAETSDDAVLGALSRAMRRRGERHLPKYGTAPAQLLADQHCLPLLGTIDGLRPRSRRLFEELLAASPAVVSLCIWPTSAEMGAKSRRVAGNLKRFLAPFASEIASSGFAEFQALRGIYDRYFLPETYLMQVSLRVAARQDEQAIGVATLLGATLGGLRAFRVRPPTKDRGLHMLRELGVDAPEQPFERLSEKEAQAWTRRLALEFTAAGVRPTDDQNLIEFLTRLPHIYSLEEVERLGQLPIADDEGLPGFDTRLVPPFSDPSRNGAYPFTGGEDGPPPPSDRLRIGVSAYSVEAGRKAGGEWHTMELKDLTKHAFVVGSTGSGKTVTTLFLVRELARLQVPFLIIEPVKTEYYGKLHEAIGPTLIRRRLEGTSDGKPVEDFLAFDPMRLQRGVSAARHASYLKSCFEAAFPLDPVLALVLDAGIRAYYTERSAWGCGLELFTRGGPNTHKAVKFQKRDEPGQYVRVVHPSLRGFRQFFLKKFLPDVVSGGKDNKNIQELRETWEQIFKRRFDALLSGMIGVSAMKADELYLEDPNQYNPFDEMLTGQRILELDGIPDNEHKSLLMCFIMTFVFERRQADDLAARERNIIPSDHLKHVLVLEEAHRILANPQSHSRGDLAGAGAQARSVSLFVDMLAEIRAFGQGLFLVEQIPTKIVSEAVKNTNLKIMLRLTAADDREYLGEAMNFTPEQKRFVTSLRAEAGRGVDMVVFEQQLDQPRLLTLPLPKSDGRPLHDDLFPTAAREPI